MAEVVGAKLNWLHMFPSTHEQQTVSSPFPPFQTLLPAIPPQPGHHRTFVMVPQRPEANTSNTMPNQPAQEVIDAGSVGSEAYHLPPQNRIQELCTWWNTYAPISKLPDEVLLEIFALTQRLFPDEQWYREVTHVCRHWRYTAINASTLWTDPPLSQHHFAMLMLERSKSADLNIYIGSNTAITTIKPVLNCIGRIKDLTIILGIELMGSVLSLLVEGDQQASRLRKLTLECESDEPWDARPMFGLSATVFCQFRLLRELNIYNTIFDWNVLPLPNLVDLDLRQITFPARMPIHQLLDTLRQMPHLENLAIPLSQSSLLPPSTTEMHANAQVTLSRLTRLTMVDSHTYTDYIGWFLSKMTLPRLCFLWMNWEPPLSRIAPNNYHSVSPQTIQVIASSVRGGEFDTFSSLHLSRKSLFLQPRYIARSYNRHSSVRFAIQEPPHHDAARLFVQISMDILLLCHASLSRLVKLVLWEEVLLTFDELFRLSTILPSIRELEIAYSSTTALAFIGILASSPSRPPADTETVTPFSRLNLLHFCRVDFASNPSLLEALCDSLMLRYEYGVAIPKLALEDCQISSGKFALLEEIVVDVESCKHMW
ncbi:hypothetical protein D9619_005214 [Psilocybe cf. subviscida]|uniref:F-box domain-containing protein n=1 Tax=Psilocybe cf. subviscida TaxID=2480587 RepID=A0A8H5FBN2_9AGAR|nr:hypothetical protein D9619_005214 [Psilocybe cf. subviscida]